MLRKLFGGKKADNKQRTPREDAEIAHKAFLAGDLSHALFHISWALASEPMNPEWRGLLERINANVPDLQIFIPKDKQLDFARGAALAYLYAKRGDYGQALPLISYVLDAIPDLRYLPWIAQWLADKDLTERLPIEILLILFKPLFSKLRGDYIEDAAQRGFIEQIIPVLQHICDLHPNDTSFAALVSSLVRRVGRYEEALQIAQKAYSANPSAQTSIMLASAHRAMDQLELAAEYYRKALEYDPSNIAIRLDLGDLLTGAGQIQEGVDYYKQVLDKDRNHSWAMPHYLYYKSILEPDGKWGTQFEQYIKAHRDNPALVPLFRRLTPYVGYLPGPSDATINMIQQLKTHWGKEPLKSKSDRSPDNKPFAMGLSHLEPASSRLALDLFLTESGKVPAIVNIGNIQQPDPRLPHGEVDFVLWRYKGTDPEPAVKPPSEYVASAIANLAAQRPDLSRWFKNTGSLANQLGPDCLDDLIGVMVHPPKRPQGIDIWDWIYRLQVVAAMTIAGLDANQAWQGSRRQRALYSLARGPLDWSVEAALIALMFIGRENPDTVSSIAQLWMELIDNLPTSGGIPYLQALKQCGLALPALPDKLRRRLSQIHS
jgi:tetratricopeptide (TPR) repeat protein